MITEGMPNLGRPMLSNEKVIQVANCVKKRVAQARLEGRSGVARR
jgi:hypothetical protein